ncbi:MAG: hypothetical protein DMG72_08670 [Acidobacteria bacterium]|nr:MAG: hypothetical protein DMG72_08670 [Acidobacteriota bacterium]
MNQLLGWLNQIDNFDWMPPAIVFMSRNMNDALAVEKFLKDLERLAAGQMVLRANIIHAIASMWKRWREP